MRTSQLHAETESSPLWDRIRKVEHDNEQAAARILKLEAALTEMLAIYWGAGDGIHPPPYCILRAQAALED